MPSQDGSVPDRLYAMFQMQRELQRLINGYDPDEQSMEQRIDNIKDNVTAATAELFELLQEIGWKPWATSRHINRQEACGEWIDVWFFLMNIALHLDMTPDEMWHAYREKYVVNVNRQKDGYDGVTGKCPQCRRDLATITLKEVIVQHPVPRVDIHCICGRHLGSRAV